MGAGRWASTIAIVALLATHAGAADGDAPPSPVAAPPPADAPLPADASPPADAPPPPEAPAGRRVEYVDDALTVQLRQVSLSEVIDEIARQSGATVKGSLKNPRDVSAEFEKIPLADALGRLLGDQNFALVYGEDGKLRTLRLLGSPDAAPRPFGAIRVPAAAPTAAGVQGAPVQPGNLAEVLAKGHPIPLSGRLGQALGQQAQLTEVVNAGLQNEDPSIRAEAVQTAVRAIESDPELRSAVMGTLQGMDDAQLATMLRGMGGAHSEEFLIQFSGHARGSDLRAKSQGILQQLRIQGQPGGG